MCGVLALHHFVLFHGLKNERSIHYTSVLSLFHRALVSFHGFSVFVTTHGFKRASLEFDSSQDPGDSGL